MNKAKARKHLAKVRAQIPAQTKHEASEAACDALLSSAIWPASSVGLFAPLPDEADPSRLAADAPLVGYPQVVGDDLIFRVAQLANLSAVPPYGVREPSAEFTVIDHFQLIIVPGLGFTKAGHRIGYGKGYYDRYLSHARRVSPDLITVGFCFDVQVIGALPVEAHDVPLDALVTESGLWWCRPKRRLTTGKPG